MQHRPWNGPTQLERLTEGWNCIARMLCPDDQQNAAFWLPDIRRACNRGAMEKDGLVAASGSDYEAFRDSRNNREGDAPAEPLLAAPKLGRSRPR